MKAFDSKDRRSVRLLYWCRWKNYRILTIFEQNCWNFSVILKVIIEQFYLVFIRTSACWNAFLYIHNSQSTSTENSLNFENQTQINHLEKFFFKIVHVVINANSSQEIEKMMNYGFYNFCVFNFIEIYFLTNKLAILAIWEMCELMSLQLESTIKFLMLLTFYAWKCIKFFLIALI